MNKRSCFFALILLGAIADAGMAIDVIHTNKGEILGAIVATDTLKVDCQVSPSQIKHVPVNEILSIDYAGDIPDWKAARQDTLAGRYAKALKRLEGSKRTSDRAEVNQDVAFYKALCAAKLALGGTGEIDEAGNLMRAFVNDNPTSYHFFEATETIGDLLTAKKLYAKAAEYYRQLEKAPWPDYKMRAGVAIGRSLLQQGKLSEASAAFDQVMAIESDDNLAKIQKIAAYLGKADVLIAAKKPMEAAKLIETFLEKATAENSPSQNSASGDKDGAAAKGILENAPLMAKAYNIRGTAERQAGHNKAAVLAFLHVDLLYSAVPDAHAEALANLIDLWGELHKPDRADAARKTLKEKYPQSRWCKDGK